MIDLHTHTLFSDGVLLPSELVYRAQGNGYKAIALTDHGDHSTIDFIIPRIRRVAKVLENNYHIKVFPGIELTYIPPCLIASMVKRCRKLGAKIVVIHGQSPVEPVPPGTNTYGILSGADVLAHPGHITQDDVLRAKEKGVCLEITTRNGHNKTNRHVATLAKKYGARLVLNTDTHLPENILNKKLIAYTLKQSGLTHADYRTMHANAQQIIARIT